MTNLTLKITTLLMLTLSSSQVLAKSPWADEQPVAAEPVSINAPASQPAAVETSPIPAPVSVQEDTVEPLATESSNENVESFVPAAYTNEPYQTETHQNETQQGDVLDINPPTDVVAVQVLDFPRRGMSTDKVKNELGQPGEIISGIGQPPISRWIYDDRTVYFEHSTVLHVVAK